MNFYLLIASILTTLAFFVHVIIGDREIVSIQPAKALDHKHREVWTMARGGFHWVSIDLLMTGLGMWIINFTDWLEPEILLMRIMAIYFWVNAIVWLGVIAISRSFPQNYLKLGQWILLLVIGTLLWLGA